MIVYKAVGEARIFPTAHLNSNNNDYHYAVKFSSFVNANGSFTAI